MTTSIDTSGNSSFSKLVPGLQLAVDSTSLGEFKTCPRKYQLGIVEGWQPRDESVHLTFGLLLHQARENYEHQRLAGQDHEDALDFALDSALRATWNSKLQRPWASGHPAKNRQTLVQTLVWYLDALAQNDTLETVVLANGKPAVELSFRFDSGLRTADGEAILFCGHLDRIAKLGNLFYIPDIKTSLYEPNAKWAKQFTPGNQFSMYTLAGMVAFDYEIEGVIADGVQIGVTFSRFQRHLIPRPKAVIDEWLHDAGLYIKQMEEYAKAGYWPMDDKACSMYGGCPFQGVCAKEPARRAAHLKAEFVKRVWDPLQVRGEI